MASAVRKMRGTLQKSVRVVVKKFPLLTGPTASSELDQYMAFTLRFAFANGPSVHTIYIFLHLSRC